MLHNYDLPETCVRGARIERDGVVVASTQNIFTEGPAGSFLEGNFSNAELILEGCEQDVRVLLPTSFPPTPAISAAFDEGRAMRVNWTVFEPTELVRVSVGSLVGKWCVVPPTDTTILLFGYNVASVTAITTMPIVHADIGNVRAYGGSYVEMMVPR